MNPGLIAGYQSIMDFLMTIPFGLNNPAFYLLSTKTTCIITSVPLNFDLELEGDIKIEGIYGTTARIWATRSMAALIPAGENFCVTL